MIKSNIGKTIALLRKRANLTQRELADLLCVSDKAVSKWERGLSYPDVTCINKLATILDTDVESLFIEESKEQTKSWCGVLRLNRKNKNITPFSILNKLAIIDVLLSYFFLVGIDDILITCDKTDYKRIKKYCDSFRQYKISFGIYICDTTIDNMESQILNSNYRYMLINDYFFIYGAGLTSIFQKAMLCKEDIVFFSNVNMPIYFVNKKNIIPILQCGANQSKIKKYLEIQETNKLTLYRGYIHKIIKNNNDLNDCSKAIRIIEKINSIKIYNSKEIIKLRQDFYI